MAESALPWQAGWPNAERATCSLWAARHCRPATLGLVSDPASKEGQKIAAILDLEFRGADVETAAIDISIEGQLECCLEERRLRGAPPVRGIIHAAGVVQFEALATQDIASLRSGLAAKMQGAWRLHRLFIEEQLDFFVLCSSTSALLTSPLLGGYAAGNAFLDALAHHRHARGLPGLSINWGTWGEVGMAAADRRSGKARLLGELPQALHLHS